MGRIKSSCILEDGLELVSGKWKICIINNLFNSSLRFGEIKKKLPNISIKMLSQALRELNEAGLIHREDFYTKPPKVVYSITEFGISLKPTLKELEKWQQNNLEKINTTLINKQMKNSKKSLLKILPDK